MHVGHAVRKMTAAIPVWPFKGKRGDDRRKGVQAFGGTCVRALVVLWDCWPL